MKQLSLTLRLALSLAGLSLFAGSLSAADKGVMHCFTFTAVESATQADWDAFYKATSELPKKVKAVKHVWAGKLARPLRVGTAQRQYGVCMELGGPEALKTYADSQAHKDWVEVYSKVRVEGTTTFDIVPQ